MTRSPAQANLQHRWHQHRWQCHQVCLATRLADAYSQPQLPEACSTTFVCCVTDCTITMPGLHVCAEQSRCAHRRQPATAPLREHHYHVANLYGAGVPLQGLQPLPSHHLVPLRSHRSPMPLRSLPSTRSCPQNRAQPRSRSRPSQPAAGPATPLATLMLFGATPRLSGCQKTTSNGTSPSQRTKW